MSVCVFTDFYGYQQIVLKQIHSEVGYFSKEEDGLLLKHSFADEHPSFSPSGISIRQSEVLFFRILSHGRLNIHQGDISQQ